MSHSKRNAVIGRSRAAFTAMAIGLSATLVTLGGDSRWAWGQTATPAPDANIESETDQLARLIRIWDAQARRAPQNGTPPNSCNYRVETAVPMFGAPTTTNTNASGDYCSSPEALIRYACSSTMNITINADITRRTSEWISATNTSPAPPLPSTEPARDVYFHNRSVARIRRLLGQPTNGRNAPRTQPIAGITPLGHLRQQFLDLQASMTQHVEQLRRSAAPADRGQERDHNATFARLKQMIRELQFPNDRDYADQAARHCIGAQANVAFIRRFENGRVRQTVVPCPGVLLMGNAPAALGFMAMAMGKTIDTCALDGTFLNPRPRNETAQQPLSMRPLLQSLRTCTARRFLPRGQNPDQQTHVLPHIDTVPFGSAGGTTTDPTHVLANPNPQRPHCGPCLNTDLVNSTRAQGNYDHSNEALGVFLATKALEGTRISLETRPAHLQLPAAASSPSSTIPTPDLSTQSLLQFLCTDRPANGGTHHLAAIDRARIVLESSSVFKNQVLKCTGAQITTRPVTTSARRSRTIDRTNLQVDPNEALPRGCMLNERRSLVPDPATLSALGNAGGRASPTPTAPPTAPAASPTNTPATQPVITPTPPAGPTATTTEAPTPTPEATPALPAGGASTTGGDGAGPLTTFASATEPQLTARRNAIEAAILQQNPACLALASRFTPDPAVFTQRCGTNNNDGRFDLDLRTGSGDSRFPSRVSQGGYTVEIGCQMRCLCGDNHCWSPEATYRGQTAPALVPTTGRFPTTDPALAAAITSDRAYYEHQDTNNGRFSVVAKACLRSVAGPRTLSETACISTATATSVGSASFYNAGSPSTISLLGETSGRILDYSCTVRCSCTGDAAPRTPTDPPQCLAFYNRTTEREITEASRNALVAAAVNDPTVVYTAPAAAGAAASAATLTAVYNNEAEETTGRPENAVYLLRMPAGTAVAAAAPSESSSPAAAVAAPVGTIPVVTPVATPTTAQPISSTSLIPPPRPVELTLPSTGEEANQACQRFMDRITMNVSAILTHYRNNNNTLPTWFTADQITAWQNLISAPFTFTTSTEASHLMCRYTELQIPDLRNLLGRQINPIQILALNSSRQPQALNCNTTCTDTETAGVYTPVSTADINNPITAAVSSAAANEDPAHDMISHYCTERAYEIYVNSHNPQQSSPFSCETIRAIPSAQRSFTIRVPDNARALLPESLRDRTITCRMKPESEASNSPPRCLQIDPALPAPEFEVRLSMPSTTTPTPPNRTPAAANTSPPPAASPPAPVAITLPDIAVPTTSFQPLPRHEPWVEILLPTPDQAQATCNNFRERMVNEVDALLDYYRNNNNSLPSWVGEPRQAAWRNLVSSRPIIAQTTALDLMCSGRNNQLNAEQLSRLLNRAVQHIPFLTRGSSANAVIENRMCQQTCTTGGTAPNQTLVLNTSAMSDLNRLPALNPLTNLAAQQHFLQHLCQQTAFDHWVPATKRATLTCEELAARMRSGSGSDQHNASPIFQMTLPDNVIERALPLHSTASAPVENVHVYCHLKTSSVDAVRGGRPATPNCLPGGTTSGATNSDGARTPRPIQPEFYVSIRTESAARPRTR